MLNTNSLIPVLNVIKFWYVSIHLVLCPSVTVEYTCIQIKVTRDRSTPTHSVILHSESVDLWTLYLKSANSPNYLLKSYIWKTELSHVETCPKTCHTKRRMHVGKTRPPILLGRTGRGTRVPASPCESQGQVQIKRQACLAIFLFFWLVFSSSMVWVAGVKGHKRESITLRF